MMSNSPIDIDHGGVVMSLLCAGRLIRYGGEQPFAFTVQSPLPTAVTVALWSRLAVRMALFTAQARHVPIRGTFRLQDAEGISTFSPQTIEIWDPERRPVIDATRSA